ncbi:MAG TPA: hypothetical protein VGH92_05590 [Gaiellaceae bacterium]
MAEKHMPKHFTATTNFRGNGETLEAAIENAWQVAKESGARPGDFRLVDIGFNANNPIREYSVVIGPLG